MQKITCFGRYIMGSLSGMLLVVGLIFTIKAQASDIIVKGWPDFPSSFENDVQWPTVGSHPIWGRITCPTLTRLNLLKLASENFLLEDLSVEQEDKIWKMKLKSGLTWWDGTPLTAQDIKDIIEKDLPKSIDWMSLTKWKTPSFQIKINQNNIITVSWSKAPEFGPYILNYLPIKKASAKGETQCAGFYRVDTMKETRQLIIKDKNSRLPGKIIFTDPTNDFVGKDFSTQNVLLNFVYASDFAGSPQKRLPDEQVPCDRPIDLPLLTVIEWNPHAPQVANPLVRQALTTILPRGALLRAGAGFLGDLVSGPFLRGHPGYDRNLVVRPNDFELANKQLTHLGFVMSATANPKRLTPKGDALILTLKTPPNPPDLLIKIIADSFASQGIGVKFIGENSEKSVTIDGLLTTMVLPWPDGNLMPRLHSQANENKNLFKWHDEELDHLLEAYGKSLTEEKPDFNRLNAIHRHLYDLEPYSILMQHRTCLKVKGSSQTFAKIFIRNPDWFYELLQQIGR